jgi:hypothetical protein
VKLNFKPNIFQNLKAKVLKLQPFFTSVSRKVNVSSRKFKLIILFLLKFPKPFKPVSLTFLSILFEVSATTLKKRR